MKTLIALILFAACGYGAYTHVQSLETAIATTTGKTAQTARDNDATRAEIVTLEQRLRETLANAEAEKLKAEARVKETVAAEIAKRKADQEELIAKLISPPTDTGVAEIKLKLDELRAESERAKSALIKPLQLNTLLKGYVSAEETKGKEKFTPSPAL